MPIIRLSLWSGRTKEEKAAMAKALTEALVKVANIPPQAVIVQIEELPKENWATGGKLHSELF